MTTFATFYVCYPGLDPLKLTIAVFVGLVERGIRVRASIDGTMTDGMVKEDQIERDNRRILVTERFKWMLDPYNSGDE